MLEANKTNNVLARYHVIRLITYDPDKHQISFLILNQCYRNMSLNYSTGPVCSYIKL